MKWTEDSKKDIVVTGGQGDGDGVTQFYYPRVSKKPFSYTIKIDQRK
jgi:hypothetical protein